MAYEVTATTASLRASKQILIHSPHRALCLTLVCVRMIVPQVSDELLGIPCEQVQRNVSEMAARNKHLRYLRSLRQGEGDRSIRQSCRSYLTAG